MGIPRSITSLVGAMLAVTVCASCGEPTTPEPTTPEPTTVESTTAEPKTAEPKTAEPAAAPSGCEGSQLELADATAIAGVTLKLLTDATNTTLLLTNSGSLSVAVFPPEDGTTRLAAAPYANPSDAASVEALHAVASVANPNNVPEMPQGVPLSQVYFVPPGWSVCATTGDLSQAAHVRYLRDKASSATYFATKALGDQLVKFVTPKSIQKMQTLETCAKETDTMLTSTPRLTDTDLYTGLITGGTACRSSFNALLGDAEEAKSAETGALKWLERTPQLLENSKFFVALAHH